MITIITPTNTNNGYFQSCVTSNNRPSRMGPNAAIQYPTDCAIPDSSAASFACFARIDKKVNASAKFELDAIRSEEHTSELQSRFDLVCRLLLEKKNITSFSTMI